jgi:TolB-like protein/Tfp pilus assembly protein PilF
MQHECRNERDQNAIREQLDRILKSGPFQQSRRRQRFLEYIVNETLAGHGERLKGYNVGREVFDRPPSFDPLIDPVVRVEAARLRDKLREYYEAEGHDDPVRIELPKGSYVPLIEVRQRCDGKPVADPEAGEHPPLEAQTEPKPLNRTVAGAALATLLVFLFGIYAWREPTPSPPRSEKASIAVLPFENIGDEPAWRRFADGITEDIITDLSQSKDLFVVARNSTEVYRGKSVDVRDVGRDLGVRYVLEGSIQTIDGRIRVTAQLIDARTGGHVWSNRYNRPAADLFGVQSDVTENIAATLIGYQGALAQAERSLIRRKPPADLTAYEHYLLGMEAKHGGASGGITKEGLEEAERKFRKALEIDPQLARAYVGLSYVYEYRLDLGIDPAELNFSRLLEAARSAVQLDPNDGETQLVLGHAYSYQGMPEKALEQFAKAEVLAPNNADVLILIAWYLPQLNQPERAVSLAEKAIRLNPHYPNWYNQGLRYVYFFVGKFELAVKYVRLVPDPVALDYAYLAAASALMDDMETAKTAAAVLKSRDADWSVEEYLSDNGGFPDRLANIFIDGAKKAGVTPCVPADKLTQLPNLIRARTCDEERVRNGKG